MLASFIDKVHLYNINSNVGDIWAGNPDNLTEIFSLSF
jgi:hypothetical protein